MAKKDVVRYSYYDKTEIDAIAEREGEALRTQAAFGNLASKPSRRKKPPSLKAEGDARQEAELKRKYMRKVDPVTGRLVHVGKRKES
jgi:hypothetical protein